MYKEKRETGYGLELWAAIARRSARTSRRISIASLVTYIPLEQTSG